MASAVSVADLNTDFLPLVYDIVRSLDESGAPKQAMVATREQHASDANAVNAKVTQFRDRLALCRQLLHKIDGIAVTREEQLKTLDALRQQLQMKRDLLLKYKHACPFDAALQKL